MQKELYRFVEGTTIHTYTSADEPEMYGSETYECLAMGRDEIANKTQLSKATVNVTVPINSVIAQRWLATTLETNVTLTIFLANDAGTFVSWKGRLQSVKPDGPSCKLAFESIFTSLRRPGLRLSYQRTCPYVLYGQGCNRNNENPQSARAVAGNVIAVAGQVVTVDSANSQPDGFFTGGLIVAPDGSQRFITRHFGQNLTIIRFSQSIDDEFALSGAFATTIYPGCDRSIQTCHDKFDNEANNGAFYYIPLINPFANTSIV